MNHEDEVMDVVTDVYDRAAQIDEATDEVIDLVSAALQSRDREAIDHARRIEDKP